MASAKSTYIPIRRERTYREHITYKICYAHVVRIGNFAIIRKSSSDFPSLKGPSLRILVTGFGSFPGVHDNPTALLIHALGKYRARLARLGIALECAVLPVNYAGVGRTLEELNETFKPDAILHFGLAARRTYFSIETRALNRLSLLHCDASGARAPRRTIVAGGAHAARSTFPCRQIKAALRHAGLRARLSVNAGNYVCNETLYLSLTHTQARSIGFIHVPRIMPRDRRKNASHKRRPSLDDVTRAAVIAILVTAQKLRQDPVKNLAKESISMISHHDFVMTQTKGPALDPAPSMA